MTSNSFIQKTPFPNFFIVGANKAGTTSLHYYCSQHPDIFMAAAKEPMFFTSRSPAQEKGLDEESNKTRKYRHYFTLQEYMELFESATEPLRGESSTNYLAHPDAAVWISKFNPNSKIIAILRNPVERAISDFKFQIKVNKWEKRSFSQAINDALDGRIKDEHTDLVKGALSFSPRRYLTLGLYGSHVEKYKKYFPEKNLLIADYDDYNKDTKGFVQRVYKFLGTDDLFSPDIRRLNTSNNEGEFPLDKELAVKIKDFFKEDIIQLQKLVDFDVIKWLQ